MMRWPLLAVLGVLAGPAAAMAQQPPPALPGRFVTPDIRQLQRATKLPPSAFAPQPHVMLPAPPQPLASHPQDVGATRFIPPKIMAFLNDRRISPEVRFFLHGVAAKPTEDWTLQEFQTTAQLVPTLTEFHIATATLSDFYAFLGLDPASLFEPQLGANWQSQSTRFDVNDITATQQAECFARLGYGENLDPTQVTLKARASCIASGGGE